MNASELFQAGQLDAAAAAAIEEIKADPGDLSRRAFLFAMLCFQGDLDRAGKQLSVLDAQTTQTEAAAYLNLLHAEQARRAVFYQGARPRFFFDPPVRIETYLSALRCLNSGRCDEAFGLLESAEEHRPEFAGTLDGTPFDDFADADDVTRSVIEFYQGRDYYWLPVDQLLRLQIVVPDPVRPRDLLWAPCQVIFKSGEIERGFTPGLYVDSFRAGEDELRLGHSTRFDDVGAGVFRGIGRKQFVAGDADPTPFELKDVSFN